MNKSFNQKTDCRYGALRLAKSFVQNLRKQSVDPPHTQQNTIALSTFSLILRLDSGKIQQFKILVNNLYSKLRFIKEPRKFFLELLMK